MRDNRNTLPMWLGGLLLALALIVISNRAGGGVNTPALIQRFAPRPTDPNAPTAQPYQLPQVSLPSLPPALQRAVTSLRDRLAGGEAIPALTPVANGPRVRVEVSEVKRVGERIQVRGKIANSTETSVAIPPGAFSFRDSRGVIYATVGSAGSTLQGGQSTSFDLGVPLPPNLGLSLILTLPPDQPLEQILVVETKP
jgi:hypothetical protein